VLVEKPMTASVAEADSLIDIAAKRNLTLMVDHTFIYTGAVKKMKELIARGDLGELYYFDSVRINLGLFQKDVNVLWDLAPHDIAILDHLVEEAPVSVCANGVCHIGNGIENVAYLTVYFQSGLIAHFHNNWLAPVKIRTLLVGGSKKMILYDDMEISEKVKIYDRGVETKGTEGVHQALLSYRLGDMWAPKLDTTEALRLVTAEFVNSIKAGCRPLTDGVNGGNVVKILEAAEMSIKHRGREVKL
jgi:predicted dehydrogenase